MITKEWLTEQRACNSGYRWFIEQTETDEFKLVETFIKMNRTDWAVWLIVHLLTHMEQIGFSGLCRNMAEKLYEEKYKKENLLYSSKPELGAPVMNEDPRHREKLAEQVMMQAYVKERILLGPADDVPCMAVAAAKYLSRAAMLVGREREVMLELIHEGLITLKSKEKQ